MSEANSRRVRGLSPLERMPTEPLTRFRAGARTHPLPQGERVHRVLGLGLVQKNRASSDHNPLQHLFDVSLIDLPLPADQDELGREPIGRREL